MPITPDNELPAEDRPAGAEKPKSTGNPDDAKKLVRFQELVTSALIAVGKSRGLSAQNLSELTGIDQHDVLKELEENYGIFHFDGEVSLADFFDYAARTCSIDLFDERTIAAIEQARHDIHTGVADLEVPIDTESNDLVPLTIQSDEEEELTDALGPLTDEELREVKNSDVGPLKWHEQEEFSDSAAEIHLGESDSDINIGGSDDDSGIGFGESDLDSDEVPDDFDSNGEAADSFDENKENTDELNEEKDSFDDEDETELEAPKRTMRQKISRTINGIPGVKTVKDHKIETSTGVAASVIGSLNIANPIEYLRYLVPLQTMGPAMAHLLILSWRKFKGDDLTPTEEKWLTRAAKVTKPAAAVSAAMTLWQLGFGGVGFVAALPNILVFATAPIIRGVKAVWNTPDKWKHTKKWLGFEKKHDHTEEELDDAIDNAQSEYEHAKSTAKTYIDQKGILAKENKVWNPSLEKQLQATTIERDAAARNLEDLKKAKSRTPNKIDEVKINEDVRNAEEAYQAAKSKAEKLIAQKEEFLAFNEILERATNARDEAFQELKNARKAKTDHAKPKHKTLWQKTGLLVGKGVKATITTVGGSVSVAAGTGLAATGIAYLSGFAGTGSMITGAIVGGVAAWKFGGMAAKAMHEALFDEHASGSDHSKSSHKTGTPKKKDSKKEKEDGHGKNDDAHGKPDAHDTHEH